VAGRVEAIGSNVRQFQLGDDIIARLHPKTGKIENFEVLFFTSRLLRRELFSLPVIADLCQVTTE